MYATAFDRTSRREKHGAMSSASSAKCVSNPPTSALAVRAAAYSA
jgi:hypothetical protein